MKSKVALYSIFCLCFLPLGCETGPPESPQPEIPSTSVHNPLPSVLDFGDPQVDEAAVLSGVYGSEGEQWRWTSSRAVLELQKPPQAEVLRLNIAVPDLPIFQRSHQGITVLLDSSPPIEQCCYAPGSHEIAVDLPELLRTDGEGPVRFELRAKISFVPAESNLGSDTRDLGFILKRVALE